jgi:hypothetical protein
VCTQKDFEQFEPGRQFILNLIPAMPDQGMNF